MSVYGDGRPKVLIESDISLAKLRNVKPKI